MSSSEEETDIDAAEGGDGLVSNIHRDEDGNPLALTITLSPDQIKESLPEGAKGARPVVRNGSIHLDPVW